MVDVYPYLIERLPRRLPIYKERTSNVYLDVYLFSIFSEKDVYLELAPSLKWVDVAMKKGRHWDGFAQQEKTNKKRSFYSCFSTEVDLLTLLGRRLGRRCFLIFLEGKYRVWVDVAPIFTQSMVYFLIFGGF